MLFPCYALSFNMFDEIGEARQLLRAGRNCYLQIDINKAPKLMLQIHLLTISSFANTLCCFCPLVNNGQKHSRHTGNNINHSRHNRQKQHRVFANEDIVSK